MKTILLSALIFQIGIVFSQNFIIYSNGDIVESNEISLSNDTVSFIKADDANKKIEVLPINKIAGIKYKNGSVFKNKDIRLNINKIITDLLRTNKKGLHIEFSNSIGFGSGYYVKQPNIVNEYDGNGYEYNNYYSSDFGYYGQAVLSAKYYVNNFFGVKIGAGYNYNNYYVNEYYNDYQAEYYIHSAVIPIRAFLSPGNKFGFYVEGGVTFGIPFSAYYHESYTINGENYNSYNQLITYLDPFSLALEGTIGLHTTINKNIIIFAGISPSINLISSLNTNSTVGFKIGVSYHVLPQK